MTAGGSAARWGQEQRAAARRGLWRRLLAWAGLNPAARRADALAARTALGAEWEQHTAAMLAPLEAAGWRLLHDRALPGSSANLDHVLVSPCGTRSSSWTRNAGMPNAPPPSSGVGCTAGWRTGMGR